ncbi:hypothetical protein [Mucilaginibacter sp. FT3.2]|nr:hypothetical protein [Mucilaginibacter sp. FT3.2]MBB6234047.1 hypothetical protein [Mucilaginibacter sp. FT3.2]
MFALKQKFLYPQYRVSFIVLVVTIMVSSCGIIKKTEKPAARPDIDNIA